MKDMKFVLIILSLLVLLPGLVLATVSVSTDQSGADLPDVIAERTFTVTASGWSGDCNSAYIDLSSCGVCSISENQTKTISGDSVSWTTLTASRANSQTITVSVSGTCTPDSGYVTFDAKTAPSLSATVSPTSTSVTRGSTFSLSLNIQNNGETTAKFGSITVSPSDFSISSGCSPSDISGGQSSGISCTIAASSSATLGTQTLSILISPTNTDSLTKTVSVIVSSASSTTTTISGGGAGGAGGGISGNTTTTTTLTTLLTTLPVGVTTTVSAATTTIPTAKEGILPSLPEIMRGPKTNLIIASVLVVIIILVGDLFVKKSKAKASDGISGLVSS